MSVEQTPSGPAPGEGAINASANAEAPAASAADTTETAGATVDPKDHKAVSDLARAAHGAAQAAGVVTEDGKPAYTPNYKYKAALQEKELDKFWHPLIKDADSEKKVKELFSKVDAFDFVADRRKTAEQQLQSINNDYQAVRSTVERFNESVKGNDLTSAFRIANIPKEAIFRWTQQQLELMDMPPQQRQQFEQAENARLEKMDLDQRYQHLQTQYETQATQTRVMQLDFQLSKPEVASFANAWDQNSGQPGAFKQFVIEEAKKVFYDTNQDISAEQAVAHVMSRFGKFLNVAPQAPTLPSTAGSPGQNAKPVIPNVTGKAVSPIKKVATDLKSLREVAKARIAELG